MDATRRNFVVSALAGGSSLAMAPGGPLGAGTPVPPPKEEHAAGENGTDSQRFREAALRGDTRTVAAFLDRDPALLYSRDAHDVSVFRLAVLAGQPGVADLLRARGLVLDLFDAATAGDEQRMSELYRDDPGIAQTRTRFGLTAMGCAAQAGQPPIVEFLNGRGADPNANLLDRDGRPLGFTPLRLALDFPQKEKAEKMAGWMLGNGANANAAQKDGASPLHAAARAGYDGAVAMLLRKGADAGAKDADGRTPLEVALLRGGNPAAELLRSAGRVPLDLYTTRFLASPGIEPAGQADADGIPQDFINRFVTVCHFDPAQTKRLYGLCPALVNTRSTWNEMGIEGAAHVGTVPCAEFLLEKGAPLSICTATMMGMADHVRDLLALDPHCAAERGAHDFPPLLYTTFSKERVDIAELLLKAGADPNANMRGVTPLHFAARRGYVQLVELLLANGADPNLPADYPFMAEGTALAVATRYKRDDVAALLRAHGARME